MTVRKPGGDVTDKINKMYFFRIYELIESSSINRTKESLHREKSLHAWKSGQAKNSVRRQKRSRRQIGLDRQR